MEKRPRLVQVAVDAPVRSTLTYILPDSLYEDARTGVRVIAPLGRRMVTGYLIDFPETSELSNQSLKQVESIIDKQPLFDGPMLEMFAIGCVVVVHVFMALIVVYSARS